MLVWTNIVLGWKGPHSEKVWSSVRMISGGCPVWAMTCYHLSIIDRTWYYRCDEILTALARSWRENHFSEEWGTHSLVPKYSQVHWREGWILDWIWLMETSINTLTSEIKVAFTHLRRPYRHKFQREKYRVSHNNHVSRSLSLTIVFIASTIGFHRGTMIKPTQVTLTFNSKVASVIS